MVPDESQQVDSPVYCRLEELIKIEDAVATGNSFQSSQVVPSQYRTRHSYSQVP